MRLFISGPMTGHPDFNYPAFFDAERRLREMGHEPVNPARTDGDGLGVAVAFSRRAERSYEEYLRAGLAQLITCEGIALIEGWAHSPGSRFELHVASTLGMGVYMFTHTLLDL